MKVRDIRLRPNTDGTFQVDVCGEHGMCCSPMDDLTYSAKDLTEAMAKIKEGMSELEGRKEKKTSGKMGAIGKFLEVDDEEEDSEG